MRKTGRTFRALLRALNLASEGNHVVFLCGSRNVADCNFNIAIRIVSLFMMPERLGERVLRIGSGSIWIASHLDAIQISTIERSDGHELVVDD